jgi:hypothetical protein
LLAAFTSLLTLLFPKQDDLQFVFAVVAPIAAFFGRLLIGRRHFELFPHLEWQRKLFYAGIVWLIFFDSLLIVVRQWGEQFSKEDSLILLAMYLPYLAVMATAFFPISSSDGPFEELLPLT